jgi:hypothetical protein
MAFDSASFASLASSEQIAACSRYDLAFDCTSPAPYLRGFHQAAKPFRPIFVPGTWDFR